MAGQKAALGSNFVLTFVSFGIRSTGPVSVTAIARKRGPGHSAAESHMQVTVKLTHTYPTSYVALNEVTRTARN